MTEVQPNDDLPPPVPGSQNLGETSDPSSSDQNQPPDLLIPTPRDNAAESVGAYSSPALRDFTKEDELSDVTLLIEGTQLHVHRQYLAEWSPVWRRMFLGGFLEQHARQIPLPGKRIAEVTELLHCIYSSQKPISDGNVRFLLELAEEYQIDRIKRRCEDFLLTQQSNLEALFLAQKFRLRTLYRRCVNCSKTKSLRDLERNPNYVKLSAETKVEVLKAKTEMLCDYTKNLENRETLLSRKSDLLTMERDNMKASLQAIHGIWGVPNKRCYKHVTDKDFNFSCSDCNENMYREIRALCGRGQHLRRYFPPK
ncbi:BTB and MATH domain-containing protein 38-like [Mizuhopecten yessoensis]|uniref:BTB and MATH domain-containing protein 38-like n=1 Tax=Mizuhopecten yessoensis TaxID=6573 RepID=UPI000B45B92F|nr:BTB and MATH domain-containing protein 38-like [Mizuhopecten yessoensis]